MKKNNEGKLPRIVAKENEHKEAMKECKKAEKAEAKGRGSKAGTEPWAIRVRIFKSFVYVSHVEDCLQNHYDYESVIF